MAESKGWSTGAKLLTGSVASLLLSIGLCGMGFTLEGGATTLQQVEMGAGLVLLVGAFILLIAAIVAWLTAKP